MTIEDKFKKTTGYDIYDFFNQFITFVEGDDYQNLISYYNGVEGVSRDALNKLDDLKNTSKNISGAFSQYSDQLADTSEYFLLLERFEEVNTKLETISNLDIWLRSSVTNTYVSKVEKTYIQKQNETLEQISNSVGNVSSNDDWVDIAMRNDLDEEKYTPNGGAILQVSLDESIGTNVNTVLGSLSGEKIYGVDLDKKITFVDGDLKVLSGKETIYQSFDILLNLIRGQVPEFPLDGINKDAAIGRSAAAVMYPSIFRQLSQLFQKNDSFSKLALINIETKNDSGYMEIQATTKLGEILTGDVII